MNTRFDLDTESQWDAKFNAEPQSQLNDAANFARNALCGVGTMARSGVVNRTHRVVRERAKVIKARRSRARSLMAPLIICSVLLILTCFAIWSGLDQYQASDAVSTDMIPSAGADTSNQLLVVLLWFVPVSITLLATVLYRRTHNSTEHEALR